MYDTSYKPLTDCKELFYKFLRRQTFFSTSVNTFVKCYLKSNWVSRKREFFENLHAWQDSA